MKNSCQNWAYNLCSAFWNLDLCQVFIIFCTSKFSNITKIELKTKLSLVSKKKKRRPEFWRYEKSTQYKFFLIILPKLSTKCKELIFDLTPSFFFLASILCVIFGHFYSKWIFWSITCEPYLWKSKFRKLRPWWQAEKYFWEVFILVSLSLSSFGNSVYPRKVYSQVPA